MLGIGLGAATILAVAAKVFYVEVDPRITNVEDALPGANCGGCGYAGCSACAEAIVQGKARVDACIAGGVEVAARVAAIMGVSVGKAEPRSAHHFCTGGDRAERKYVYEGTADCRALYALHGGDLRCKVGCFGLGTCLVNCPFDAIAMGPEGYPYVMADRCTGCGTCERVCPTGVIRVYKQSEKLMHFNHASECLPPCRQLCPAQIDIPRYIDLSAKGRYAQALEVIRERNPLPLICGRVCPAPCEAGCRRAAIGDEPVHHNYIKRFVADWEMSQPSSSKPVVLADTGKRIAIIGGGPCGLTAAYYLRRLGHHPVIFEAKPALGGMARYGIPEYRLPKKTLDFEINKILELGVEVHYNQSLGNQLSIDELEKNHDAVLFAMGAWDNSSLRCEGEDLEGVWKGTEFLQKRELGIHIDLGGKRVVVVGGGNTAMDACRSALRMGAADVTLLYRRTRREMPANAVEIEAAEHEGVNYQFLAAPERLIAGRDGKLCQIEYIKMELGEPDASGRRRPVPVEGSNTVMNVDVVIAAIGQRPLTDWYTPALKDRGLKLTRWDTILADEKTLQTDIPHMFTAGDLWSGPALLIDAVGTGRRAARSIHLFLSGRELGFPVGTYTKPERLAESNQVEISGVEKSLRVQQPELEAKERIHSFDEVDLVLGPEEMQAEAKRCMRCGTLCFFSDRQRNEHVDGKSLGKRINTWLEQSPMR